MTSTQDTRALPRAATSGIGASRGRGMVWFRRLHRWIGLAMALPLAMQGITGTAMILLQPDDDAARPRLHRTATDASAPVPSAAFLVAAARRAAPPGLAPLRFAPAREAGDSAAVGFGHAGSRFVLLDVFVDPATAQVTGTHRGGRVFATIRNLHTALLLPPPIGRPVVGVFAIGLFLLGLTGVVLWWPNPLQWRTGAWRRNFVVERRAWGPRLLRETHLALGGWSLLMMLLMSGTGMMLAYPDATRTLLHIAPAPSGPAPTRPHPGTAPAAPAETGLDLALARLHADQPGARLVDVALGTAPAPFMMRLSVPELPRNQALLARADRSGRSLRIVRDPRRQHGGERVVLWAHLLHQARLPGPSAAASAWSVVVGVTGAALAGFAVTGAALWLLRRRRRAPVAPG